MTATTNAPSAEGAVSPGQRLAHGPLTYRVGIADIGAVRWNQHELIRRIFVTVRDRLWREVPPSSFDAAGDAGQLRMSAHHRNDLIDYRWTAEVTLGAGAKEMVLSFRGEALRDMETNRLGLAVLHPVRALIGSRLRTEGPDGDNEIVVEEDIYPQHIVDGTLQGMLPPLNVIETELRGFGHVRFAFEGDLFELEDQRNWCDASFKTYTTPLRVPFPRRVRAGDTLDQKVTITFVPHPVAATPMPARPEQERAVFPILACEFASMQETAQINWPRVLIDAPDRAAGTVTTGSSATLIIRTTESDQDAAIDIIKRSPLSVDSVLVCGGPSPLPKLEGFRRVKAALQLVSPDVPIYAGTSGYFSEVNRGNARDLQADGVCFAVSPTVHDDDPWTVADNAGAIADMIRTARRRTDLQRVVIAPLAMFLPPLTGPGRFRQDHVASWLVATLCDAASASPNAIVLGADVVRAMVADPQSMKLLTELVGLSGREAQGIRLGHDDGAYTLEATGAGPHVFVASNVADEPRTISINDRPITIGPHQVLIGDPTELSTTKGPATVRTGGTS